MAKLEAAARALLLTGALAVAVGQAPSPQPWIDATKLSTSQLLALTANQCNFVETSAWEESFGWPSLNLTRWQALSGTTLDHCPSPGAVGAANAATCTAMMPSQVQLGVPLPGYPGGGLGAIFSLSQAPCNDPTNPTACCVKGTCANWAGAHLSSNGCIQFGVLETEATFDLRYESGAVAFFGTYILGGQPDPSWNEIDQTFIATSPGLGLEHHASLFLSTPQNPTNAQEDKDVFDSSGTNCKEYVKPSKTSPGVSCPLYNTTMGANWHTYKLVWTPTWLAWMVDNTVYRNSTTPPWRPVTIRPLLRTNAGTAASVASMPDAHVYIRRIRYTPLDPSGYAIASALSCNSMASCYGNINAGVNSMVALGSNPGGTGRRLLDSTSVARTPVLNTTAVQAAIASVVPGLLPSQVTVSTAELGIQVDIWVGVPYSQWNRNLQAAFQSGLGIDVPTPSAQDVAITATKDGGALGGIILTTTLLGYPDSPATVEAECLVLQALGNTSATSLALQAAQGAASPVPIALVSTPEIQRQLDVNVVVAASSGDPAMALTQVHNAVASGAVQKALSGSGDTGQVKPVNLLTQQRSSARNQARVAPCPAALPAATMMTPPVGLTTTVGTATAPAPAPAACTCNEGGLKKRARNYEIAFIVFICAFGILSMVMMGAAIAMMAHARGVATAARASNVKLSTPL